MPIDSPRSQRARLRPAELLVGLPLQELEEADALRIAPRRTPLTSRRVRMAVRLRPLLPGLAGELLGERLEQRVAVQWLALFAAEALERLDAAAAGGHRVVLAAKAGVKRFQTPSA